jgi:hypothetical protein
VFHGIGGLSTLYRNYLVGWEVAKSTNTVPVQAYAYDRFYNIVGNVLGCNWNSTSYPGNCGVPYPTAYGPTQLGSGANKVIYDFGASLNEGSNTVGPDSYVATSAMLWGNCDAFHGFTAGNCRFVSSEVPTALTDGYQNSLPGSHTLPVSFAYTSTPSWWPSGKAFPIAGPDVTGGNINGAGGLAYTNPAQDCANTLGIPADGTGSVVPYTPCVGTQPTPPTAQTILIVGPSTASVQTNKTIQFTANCSPSPCNSVNWSTSLGSISNGLFLAPSTAGTGAVTATIGANSASYPVNVIATSTAPVVTSFSSTITVTEGFPIPSTRTCNCTFTLNAQGNGYSKSCAPPCK